MQPAVAATVEPVQQPVGAPVPAVNVAAVPPVAKKVTVYYWKCKG